MAVALTPGSAEPVEVNARAASDGVEVIEGRGGVDPTGRVSISGEPLRCEAVMAAPGLRVDAVRRDAVVSGCDPRACAPWSRAAAGACWKPVALDFGQRAGVDVVIKSLRTSLDEVPASEHR